MAPPAVVWVPLVLGALLLVAASLWTPPERAQLAPVFVRAPARPLTASRPLAASALRAAAAAYVPDVFNASSGDAPPLAFLPAFRNPCWRNEKAELRCLPLVHVLGAYQCAASDLFGRLARHADFAPPQHASPSFYFEQNHKWGKYLRTFARAAVRIEAAPALLVTGEGSGGMLTLTWTHSERLHQPYILTMGRRWQACNANRTRGADSDARFNACMAAHIPTAHALDAALVARAGARLEVPHLLRAVQGEAVRLICLLRNPTDRVYAAYWHYPHYRGRYGSSALGFATYHAEQQAHLDACVGAHGLEACALRFEGLERRFERVFYHCDQLFKSIYAPYVRVWARAYAPRWRELLLVLRTEDYAASPRASLERVFSFVGLRAPDEGWWASALAAPRQRNGAARDWSRIPPMPAETRAAVDGFYRPHNADLARFLADPRFEWPERTGGHAAPAREGARGASPDDVT